MATAAKKLFEIPVRLGESSAISNAVYNPFSKILKVQFTSGNKFYDFGPVPPEVILDWEQAESVGKFYHQVITGYKIIES